MNFMVSSSFCIHAFLLWCLCMSLLYSPSHSTTTMFGGNETDRLALLALKAGITHDPLGVMSSWNDSHHFCEWEAVRCGGRRHPEKVRFLDLEARALVGLISPHIGNLSFLRELHLQNNSLHGEIPQEVGRLFRLQILDLRNNSLGGKIPTNISHCSNLIVLALNRNNLEGKLPVEFGNLAKLRILLVNFNNLVGEIPYSFGNLSSLNRLGVAVNNLEGSIPDVLGSLRSLNYLILERNKLSGMVPSSIYNLSSIIQIYLGINQLQGSLPPDLGFMLPNVQVFSIGTNQFTGTIPISLSNSSELVELEIRRNNFSGKVPINFGRLQSLLYVSMGNNYLGSGEAGDLSFINTLTNCSSLIQLTLNTNNFGGVLPTSIANLSTQLWALALGQCQIFGVIPTEIENLENLEILRIEYNLLTGKIPSSIGKLQKLQVLEFGGNKLSGQIPSSLGNLTLLSRLGLERNNLEGGIPPSMGNCKKLLRLDLSLNMLGGIIPKEVFGISSLSIGLDLSQNNLVGSLPLEVGNLKNLGVLHISKNKLSGEIPNSLGGCESLENLYMDSNFFQGSIPSSLSFLKAIQELNLSQNNLSGLIPDFLQNFSLIKILDLSFNDLEGEVPTEGVFRNTSALSINGNGKLCGGVSELHLPACAIQKPKKQGRSLVFKLAVALSSGVLLCFILMFSLYFLYWRKNPGKTHSSNSLVGDHHLKISYEELLKATGGFSSTNMIGAGSFGCVYKGILSEDETLIVAVKVLNLHQEGASKSFMAECEALRSIRHRNILKILTSCSSTDFKGNDFKALVFEFMPNGSLEKWLHPNTDNIHDELRYLNLLQRLNIAIDVASALEYLHHHCQIPIIHCDLKPSNILLDNDMTAHVGDFGLSKFLSETTNTSSQNQTSSIGVKGSIGYAAPEYGVGAVVSSHGDLYSYGILLLEMFTGKRPIDEMFKDGLNLHYLAKMALPDGVLEIVDPILLSDEEEEEEEEEAIYDTKNWRNIKKSTLECLTSVIRIGVACSVESPRERMNMIDVVKELNFSKDVYLGVRIHG